MNTQVEEIHLRDYWRILSTRRNVFFSFFFMVVGIVLVVAVTWLIAWAFSSWENLVILVVSAWIARKTMA